MNETLSPTLAVPAGFRLFAVFLAGWLRLLRLFRSREEVALAEWFESYVTEVFRRLEVVLSQPPVPEERHPRPVRARVPGTGTPCGGLPRGPSYGRSSYADDAPSGGADEAPCGGVDEHTVRRRVDVELRVPVVGLHLRSKIRVAAAISNFVERVAPRNCVLIVANSNRKADFRQSCWRTDC